MQLEDSRVAIATLASSRYVGPIKEKVEEWQRQFDIMHETLVGTNIIVRITPALEFMSVSCTKRTTYQSMFSYDLFYGLLHLHFFGVKWNLIF